MARPKPTEAQRFARRIKTENSVELPEFVVCLVEQVENGELISPSMLSDYNSWAGQQKIARLEAIKQQAEAELKEARKLVTA